MQGDRWQLPSELMPRLMQRLGLRERLRGTEVIEGLVKKSSATSSPHTQPLSHCEKAYSTSESSNRHCTTSSNKSPRPKSCENSNSASAGKPSATSVSASAENFCRLLGRDIST